MQHPAYSLLRPVTESIGVVLCPNAGYSSLEGTNSWVVRAQGDPNSIVIDPGPHDEGHLNVLQANADHVGLILLTHRHQDHAGGAERFAQMTGAPVRSLDPRYCVDGSPLVDGEVVSIDGVTPTVEVVATPGHTAHSTCFFVHGKDDEVEGIITGDTILGRHTSMISETDGDLGQYIESLKLLVERGKGIPLLPGHGPDHPDTADLAARYIERREYRLKQVREALAELGPDAKVRDIVDKVYDNVDPVLRDSAEQSTRVTLRYIHEHD